jgi:hypothetical protein
MNALADEAERDFETLWKEARGERRAESGENGSE